VITENVQPIEKVIFNQEGALDVVSVFSTIQGEGPFTGTPATFVRLAGCNLRCVHCDTDYTRHRQEMPILRLLNEVRHHKNRLVVLTGGEPFRQNIGPFVRLLKKHMYRVQIETNGTLPPYTPEYRWSVNIVDSIVCSPKTPLVNKVLIKYVDAWKYVLEHDHVDPKDGLPTSVLGAPIRPCRPKNRTEVFVQPADDQDAKRNQANIAAALKVCMEHGYRLSLQTHKILGLA